MIHLLKIIALLGLIVEISACATTDYTTHYGIFTAQNSEGQVRKFKLYWQTIRYQGWGVKKYRALPVTLQSQCSKRDIYLYDASFGSSRRCVDGGEQGIQYCGDRQLDMDRRGLDVVDKSVCMSVTDSSGNKDILSLQGDVFLTVSCRPIRTKKRIEDGFQNLDYLRNSAIPYVVSTKTIKGKDVDLLTPDISSHSSICEQSQ